MCEAGGFAIETLPSLAGLRSADGGDLRASCMRDFLRGESASTTLVDELRPLFAAVKRRDPRGAGGGPSRVFM